MIISQLNTLLSYVKDRSPFYSEKLKKHSEISTIDDFRKLPFTNKEDISNNNKQFLCIPEDEVRDYLTTSGTLGEPISYYLSENDLKRLSYNEMKSLQTCGINEGDKILLTTTIDKCFMAGLAYYLGSQQLGAGVIRTGPGNIKYQWDMIQRFSPNVVIIVPSFLLKMIAFANENNIDLSTTSLKKAVCIGEPIRTNDLEYNSLAQEILSSLDLKLYSTYASTEMMTAFTECELGVGGHLQEDLLYLEVLDSNENEVKSGESGEVVISTLGVESMPLLRYRTGDICTVYRDVCNCGRTSLRLGPVLGRKNQRLKIKGTTIFPSSIINAVHAFKFIEEFIIEAYYDRHGSDNLCLFVTDKVFEQSTMKELKSFLKSKLLFTPNIQVTDIDTIKKKCDSNNFRKENRFIDTRK